MGARKSFSTKSFSVGGMGNGEWGMGKWGNGEMGNGEWGICLFLTCHTDFFLHLRYRYFSIPIFSQRVDNI